MITKKTMRAAMFSRNISGAAMNASAPRCSRLNMKPNSTMPPTTAPITRAQLPRVRVAPPADGRMWPTPKPYEPGGEEHEHQREYLQIRRVEYIHDQRRPTARSAPA